MLERTEPHYLMLKRHIVAGIAEGRWGIRERIPSEGELTRTFGLSRMTVNRALRELAHEGVIVREQGRGSFVAPAKAEATMVAVKSIRDEIEARGAVHQARLLDAGELHADGQTAERFAVSEGTVLYASRLLHLADGIPLQLEERLVNPASAPRYLEQALGVVMPHDYLMEVAPLESAEHVIEAELPQVAVAKLLSISTGEPVLILLRRTWSSGRVASFVRLTHPASRYQFSGRIDHHPLNLARSGTVEPALSPGRKVS